MRKWWWKWIPGKHYLWALDGQRTNALQVISDERTSVEQMALRPRSAEDPLDRELLAEVLERFQDLRTRAMTADEIEQLEALVDYAHVEGCSGAFFCPTSGITQESRLIFDQIEEWGIPKSWVQKLARSLDKDLVSQDPNTARCALYKLLDEQEAWDDLTDKYEDRTWRYTKCLFITVPALVLCAISGLWLASWYSFLLPVSLLMAGAAGSCVSVMGKMPTFSSSLGGGVDAYGRRILSRIGVGLMASLIGCSLLAWGIFPVAIQNQTFSDLLASCISNSATPTKGIKVLIVLGTAVLLGFSERPITTIEKHFFGSHSETAN